MGLVRGHREISKEQYDRAMEHNGYLSVEDKSEVFSESELCGYGVYSPIVYTKDGKYYVGYSIGTSCD